MTNHRCEYNIHLRLRTTWGHYPGAPERNRLGGPPLIICKKCHPEEYREAAQRALAEGREQRREQREEEREARRKERERKRSGSTKSIVGQLNTLAKLRKSGDITEAEFQDLKARLISESGGGAKGDPPKSDNRPIRRLFESVGLTNEATINLLGQQQNAPRPQDVAKPRKQDAKPKSRKPISVGDEVVHDTIGRGVVVAREGSGHRASLTVKFDRGVTVKKVPAVHLRRVD